MRETIRINGGCRVFKKTGNALLLNLLADMAAQGDLMKVGEMDDDITYTLISNTITP